MGEIIIVGPGKTRGYPYPVCKKKTPVNAESFDTTMSILFFNLIRRSFNVVYPLDTFAYNASLPN